MPKTMQAGTITARFALEPPERFSPLFNDAFLKIFGSADSAPVTLPLVNAVLRAVGIAEIEGIDRISADAALPGGIECKTPRLDVVVLADDGRLIDLEAQRRKADVASKSLFYAAKLLVENTPKGRDGDYDRIPQVVVIALIDGQRLFPDGGQFLSVCRMGWNDAFAPGRRADGPDDIVLIAAELDKVRELYNGAGGVDSALTDELTAWLYLLAGGYESPEEVGRMSESFPTMEEFAERYGIAIGDPDLKRKYDVWWQSEMEYNSMMSYAKREGRAEGRAEGIEEGIEEGVQRSIAALREAGLDEAADLLERTARDAS